MNLKTASHLHLRRAPAILVVAALLGAAAGASAQGFCQPGLSDFTKTVRNLSGNPRTDTRPGDLLEYSIMMCNSSTQACRSLMADFWNNVLGNAGVPTEHLEFEPASGTTGCPGDGGTICEKGTRTGPRTTLATTGCGQDCSLNPPDPEDLRLIPDPNDPSSALQPGECYFWTIRARVGTPITTTECLCDVAQVQTGPIPPPFGAFANSNDPTWTTLDPGTGCADDETCNGGAPPCGACVKVINEPLPVGFKCIDTDLPNCGTNLNKGAGSPISFYFTLLNTGRGPAKNVFAGDDLSFVSTTGVICLDFSQPVTVTPLTCTPGPCGPFDYASWLPPNVQAEVESLDPGEKVTYRVDAFVNPAGSGRCTNVWEMHHVPDQTAVPVNTNAPFWNTQPATVTLSTSTKCFDTSSPCTTSAFKPTGSPVRYEIRYENTGNTAATNVVLGDDLRTLGATCGVTPLQNATCVLGAGCGASTCTITQQPTGARAFRATINPSMPAGCVATVVLNATVNNGASGQCCNSATVDFTAPSGASTFRTGDACFTVGQPPADIATTKVADPPGQSPRPGDPVTFLVTVTNTDATRTVSGTLVDTLDARNCMSVPDCGQVVCDPGTSAAICGACAITPTGFTHAFSNLPPGQSMTFRITATAGNVTATTACGNTAQVDDSLPGDLNDTGTAAVTIDPFTAFSVRKVPSSPSVSKGTDAVFTIEIDNSAGTTALTNCSFTDDVAGSSGGCMTLKSCDSTSPVIAVTCNPPSDLRSSGTFSVAAGAVQQVVITVTAGAIEVPSCSNTVNVQCQFGSGFATGSFAITACDLMRGDVTFPPLSPLKSANGGRWVYTGLVCAPPAAGSGRLAAQQVPSAVDDTDVDTVAGAAGNLRLYQLDCPCANRVGYTKRAGMVRMKFF